MSDQPPTKKAATMTPIQKTKEPDTKLAKHLLTSIEKQRHDYAAVARVKDSKLAKLSAEDICGELALRGDKTMVAMNKSWRDAREVLLTATPVEKRAGELAAELVDVEKKLAAQRETFGVEHNLTPDQAHDRLMAVSPSYATMHKAQFEKSTERLENVTRSITKHATTVDHAAKGQRP